MFRPVLSVLAALILLAPAPAAAQSLVFDGANIDTCLQDQGDRACIGVESARCMEETPGGYSTAGMAGCLSAELDWWDADLNARYQDLRAQEQQGDADWTDIPGMTPRPDGADVLRDMQRAWIAFRDAACFYEEIQWWGGTGAGPAGTSCRMTLTAEQALRLRNHLAGE